MPTSRYSPREGLERLSRRMPLAVKLPLLLSGILAVVLAIALMATYSTLRTTAVDRARDRVERATRQLATVSVASITAQQARYLPAAGDSIVRRALRGERVDARPVLARLSLPTDSGMPVELWTADGRRVAFVGNDVRAAVTVAAGRPELPERITRTFDPTGGARTDSLRLGPLYADGGRVHFWYVMPVRERDRVLGYITHQRRVALSASTMRTLSELAGDSVSLYYRNVDGSFWTSGGGVPYLPHQEVDTAAGRARTASGERVFLNEERIGSTPIMIGLSIPERPVVARAIGPLRTLVLLSLLLLLVGGLAAWVIARGITRPLADITHAAELLGTGNFATRVPETGDHEVRVLAQTFNRMAVEMEDSRRALVRQSVEAESANNAKSDFLTTMSHELRTPLNAIGGYVDLMELELRGPVTPEQKRDLERIKASQQHLLGLISGVLDLARVESGQLTYDVQNVAVDPFLSGLDALIGPQAAAKKVSLHHVPAGADLAVQADREKLRQILLNLLSNAIRHTPPGGTVTLRALALGGRVQISVEDTGPGIPPDQRERIFEPFVQLDRSLSQPREGIGLGLAISRDLARGMSGDLVVDPHASSGARFLLTLNRGTVDARSLVMTGESPAVT